MNILALDTSTEILSVGLRTDSGYFETSISAGVRHSKDVLPGGHHRVPIASSQKHGDLVVFMLGSGAFFRVLTLVAWGEGVW